MAEYNGKRVAGYIPDYVVFDLETTGLNPVNDSIIELSALRVENNRVVDTFSTLVNPKCSIPYRATMVNNITDEMVADAPALTEVIPQFLDFTGANVLIGHNIQSFDLKFINSAVTNQFGLGMNNDYIDTLIMSRRCLPQLKSHKLVEIARHFSISQEGAHRALNDCVMNQKCYEEMAKLKVPAEQNQKICPKCGSELFKRNGRFGEFWGCGNYPNCRHTEKC